MTINVSCSHMKWIMCPEIYRSMVKQSHIRSLWICMVQAKPLGYNTAGVSIALKYMEDCDKGVQFLKICKSQGEPLNQPLFHTIGLNHWERTDTCLPACGWSRNEGNRCTVFVVISMLLAVFTTVIHWDMLCSYKHEKTTKHTSVVFLACAKMWMWDTDRYAK